MLYAMWASPFPDRLHELSRKISVLCLIAILATGCGRKESDAGVEQDSGLGGAAGRPNVLLITVDTLRPDRLSCYGYEKHRTPNIDRLASSGALFERAFCDVTWTTPSMASVMTGTYATIHGFKTTNKHSLDDRNITLAEALREHGYTTAAVIGSFPLNSVYRLDQGFDVYDDQLTAPFVEGSDQQENEKIEQGAQAIFQGWPEDVEINKIAQEVPPAAMEEHGADRRPGGPVTRIENKFIGAQGALVGPVAEPDEGNQHHQGEYQGDRFL